jgi:hypothetical protein
MRKLVIASVALVAVAASGAQGADMPLKAPPAPLAPSWTGVYVVSASASAPRGPIQP